ncbi:hypothetical protein Tco_0223979 [Tanacetum coccineum]
MQTEEDLSRDDLKHYEAKIEEMNLILISIPNDIYNSVDACTTTQAMWQRVDHLMRGTMQNKVDRKTRFNNEFDQFLNQEKHLLRIPPRRSTRLTPPTSIPTAAEAEDISLRDTIQLSIVEQKSHDDLEAKQNEEKVKEHLMAKEIKKLVEGTENIEEDEVDNSISNTQNYLGNMLEPRSHKESSKVEKTTEVQLVNTIKEEEESAEDDYELRRREKGRM